MAYRNIGRPGASSSGTSSLVTASSSTSDSEKAVIVSTHSDSAFAATAGWQRQRSRNVLSCYGKHGLDGA